MRNQKGAATVEALLVMPIAFSFAMALIWMIRIFGIHSEVGAILNDVGAGYVENSYVYAAIDGNTDDEGLALSNICEDIITEGDLIMRIKNEYAYGILTKYDDYSNTYSITSISQDVSIPIDSVVTTTGMGDIYPSGIIVGYIHGISKDNFDLYRILEMKTFADFNDINYVKVLKRGLI